MSRSKYTKEQKLKILEEYKKGSGIIFLSEKYGLHKDTIYVWINKLAHIGESELEESRTWSRYCQEFKIQAVESYLKGEGSLRQICIDFGIKSHSTLIKWINKYNNGKVLKPTLGGNHIMLKGRKTSLEERIEIVNYCIDNDLNYKITAEVYKVSYQQVYSWVKKFNEGGEKALEDRRGKAKEETQLTELDRLKIENRKLKKQNQDLELENKFLKKLEELEKKYRKV